MIAIPVVLLNGFPFSFFDLDWNPYLRLGTILIYLATLMSLLSGIIYVAKNLSVFREEKKEK
jgi:phosphatidylglycerophosphate synthase